MLQKYEAEVRNHIKIEQQLKLHIECVQDKLEDQEKQLKKVKKTASMDSKMVKSGVPISSKVSALVLFSTSNMGNYFYTF